MVNPILHQKRHLDLCWARRFYLSSKTLEALSNIKFDQVVTVCAHADQNCPVFMGKARVTHIGFDDPPKLARNARTEEQALQHFRRIRDEIREFVLTLPQALN